MSRYEYNEESFWAGVVLGTQLHGTGAYGVMSGWNPDGDLILRPITQGVPAIKFGADKPFTIVAMIDTVNEDTTFPVQDDFDLTEAIPAVIFARDAAFSIMALNERLVIDEVITAYSVDENINPLEYDDTIVFINSSGAFTMNDMTRTFTSTAQPVDIGTLQEVVVKVDEFAEVATQEVTA